MWRSTKFLPTVDYLVSSSDRFKTVICSLSQCLVNLAQASQAEKNLFTFILFMSEKNELYIHDI